LSSKEDRCGKRERTGPGGSGTHDLSNANNN
jgi:hypothetical protein